jgi:hypothetical protein
LLSFTNAERWPNLNALRFRKVTYQEVPFWQISILRMQFVIVYFFAALAKVSPDWLIHAQPLKTVLSHKYFLGFSCNQEWLAYVFSWGGFLLDFGVALLLLLGRWRGLAFTGVLLFNLINLWIFSDIEAFPLLMIAGLALFLDPQTPANITAKLPAWGRDTQIKSLPIEPARRQKTIIAFLAIYLTIQILVPLRHFLYPDNPSWSYEGSRFAWRLKINTKIVNLKVIAIDPATGRSMEVPYQNLLTPQQTWLDNIPDMLYQYVHYLKKELQEVGITDPIIHIEATAKFNDRPEQPYIDGSVDFAKVDYPLFSHAKWIIPLKKH